MKQHHTIAAIVLAATLYSSTNAQPSRYDFLVDVICGQCRWAGSVQWKHRRVLRRWCPRCGHTRLRAVLGLKEGLHVVTPYNKGEKRR